MTWDANFHVDLESMPEPEPAMVAVIMDDLAHEAEDMIRKEHPGATIIRLSEPTYTKDDGGKVTLDFQVIDPNFDRMTITLGPFEDDAK